eukprot:gene25365-28674_t
MISIKYFEIPSYLHNSVFYRSLDNDEVDSEIQIPSKCFKLDDSITNTADLSHILLVERFWGLDELPWTVMDFYYHLGDHNWKRHELDEYPALFEMWQVFTERRPLDEVMISCRRPELVSFLIEVSSPEEPYATRTAASLGRLDYLIALHEQSAATGGHETCLRYAISHGCPYHATILKKATAAGSLACLKYLIGELGMYMDVD